MKWPNPIMLMFLHHVNLSPLTSVFDYVFSKDTAAERENSSFKCHFFKCHLKLICIEKHTDQQSASSTTEYGTGKSLAVI